VWYLRAKTRGNIKKQGKMGVSKNYIKPVDIAENGVDAHSVMSARRNTDAGDHRQDGGPERVDRIAVDGAAEWLEALAPWVASLRFGVIQLVVHEGRVVQMERTEKVRFPGSKGSKGNP
jgi:hypothetical protein